MKVSIDLDSTDETGLKRARAMLASLAAETEAEAREQAEREQAEREKRERDRSEARRPVLRTPVADLDVSVRTRNALIAQGVLKIGDLVALTPAKLRSFPNIGAYTVKEIREALALLDLDLMPNERGRPLGAITKE